MTTKTLALMAMLLGAAAANASPAIWESDFGTAIVAGDDVTTNAGFGFAFPFLGARYTDFEASTNGFISIGGSNGQGCCTGYAAGLLEGAARIAPQWFDWVDTVYLSTAVAGRAVVTWQGFEFYDPSVRTTTQAQLFDSGRIVFGFDGPSAPLYHQSLTGISAGGGAADPGGTPLGHGGFRAGASFYQEFAPGTFGLNGTNIVVDQRGGGLTVGGVPEPASWAMMVAGFALVGAAARSRNRSVVAA